MTAADRSDDHGGNAVTVCCVGDVMLGDSFYAPGSGVRTSVDRFGRRFVPADVQSLLRRHDVTFGNLESPLSDVGHRRSSLRSIHMRGDPSSVDLLADWGFDVMNVANNHIFEHGRAAAVDTVARLEQANLAVVGAGADGRFGPGCRSTVVEVRGRTLCFVAACSIDDPYAFAGATEDELTEAVRGAVERGELPIVSLHWGHEFMDRPSPAQRALAHRLTAAGAVAVIGHHPHVLQGIDVTDGRLVAYSLGNFVFNGFDPDTRWSAALSFSIVGDRVVDARLVPIEADAAHRPMTAAGERKRALEREITRRNRCATDAPDDAHHYAAEVSRARERNRRRLRSHLARAIGRVPPRFLPQIAWRPVRRRLGRW